jgi:hypothetical protein
MASEKKHDKTRQFTRVYGEEETFETESNPSSKS